MRLQECQSPTAASRSNPALFLQQLCMQYNPYATLKQETVQDVQALGLHSKGHNFLTAALGLAHRIAYSVLTQAAPLLA